MGILDRVRSRIAGRGADPVAAPAPGSAESVARQDGSATPAWRTAEATSSAIPRIETSGGDHGLYRDLTTSRQPRVLAPLDRDAAPLAQESSRPIVASRHDITPATAGVVDRSIVAPLRSPSRQGGSLSAATSVSRQVTADDAVPPMTEISRAADSSAVASSAGAPAVHRSPSDDAAGALAAPEASRVVPREDGPESIADDVGAVDRSAAPLDRAAFVDRADASTMEEVSGEPDVARSASSFDRSPDDDEGPVAASPGSAANEAFDRSPALGIHPPRLDRSSDGPPSGASSSIDRAASTEATSGSATDLPTQLDDVDRSTSDPAVEPGRSVAPDLPTGLGPAIDRSVDRSVSASPGSAANDSLISRSDESAAEPMSGVPGFDDSGAEAPMRASESEREAPPEQHEPLAQDGAAISRSPDAVVGRAAIGDVSRTSTGVPTVSSPAATASQVVRPASAPADGADGAAMTSLSAETPAPVESVDTTDYGAGETDLDPTRAASPIARTAAPLVDLPAADSPNPHPLDNPNPAVARSALPAAPRQPEQSLGIDFAGRESSTPLAVGDATVPVDRSAAEQSRPESVPAAEVPIAPNHDPQRQPDPSPSPVGGADGLEQLLQRSVAPTIKTVVNPIQEVVSRAADRGPSADPPEKLADSGEFADALYDRIERRLRTELLGELERRGTLSGWG